MLRDVLGFRTAEVAEMLDTGEVAVKGALQRARATLRNTAAGRRPRARAAAELAPASANWSGASPTPSRAATSTTSSPCSPTTPCSRCRPSRWNTRDTQAIAAFLRQRGELRGRPLRVVPTRANTQPAFGCYLPDPQAAIARPYGLLVLTLEAEAVAAITWFTDTGVFRHFGLPRTLRE